MALDPRKNRKARIRRIRRENTQVVGRRGERAVRIKIDHQSFNVGYSPMTIVEAKFWRTNIAIALNRFKFGD